MIFQPAQSQPSAGGGLSYSFAGGYGQVESGGRYVGAEFHHSRPLPSRLSFYTPVANSIDLSTDYWKRDESRPMAVGVQIGDGPRHWIGRDPWPYTVSPHRVVFGKTEGSIRYLLSYEFCLNEPAMVFTLTMKNVSGRPLDVRLYTHLKPALRTCQTYTRRDSARTSIREGTFEADFDETDTDSAAVFVVNTGLRPISSASDAGGLGVTDSGTSRWIVSGTEPEPRKQVAARHAAVAAFEYRAAVNPGDSVSVVQVIGSCRRDEAGGVERRLASSWRQEADAYNELVRVKSEMESVMRTGDPVLDESAVWAKAILASNAHAIDGTIVPMPCPAEYNFYFTHDLLMTDLGAVNFDTARVKRDLLYVVSLSRDGIIPHAYYWRDDGYKTEFCPPENWNHFWFVIVTGAYLRHSLDDSTVRSIYPIVSKSLGEMLRAMKPDHLMYAFHPDWWDMGRVEGPRTYTTALAIRTVREYLFISSFLGYRTARLDSLETLADSMQSALTARLWSDGMKYLVNYNEGRLDSHYYMGSLLPAVFGLLDPGRAKELMVTASDQLLDPRVGIRTVMPPDFHTKQAIDFYKFAGEEVGKPYFYANGGVWPHDNAWYALALKEIGRRDEALQFVKATMTVDGITHSPRGHPAMYEYRFDDSSSPDYGMIDKPCFLWAGGFYLKTLYALLGTEENVWNLSIAPPLPGKIDSASFTFVHGRAKTAALAGHGSTLQSMAFDGMFVPSVVLPLDRRESQSIRATYGPPGAPYLKSIDAIVASVRGTSGTLDCTISSFRGHRITSVVVSPNPVRRATVDGIPVASVRSLPAPSGLTATEIRFEGSDNPQHLYIDF